MDKSIRIKKENDDSIDIVRFYHIKEMLVCMNRYSFSIQS